MGGKWRNARRMRNAARNRYIASEVMSTAPTAEIERAKGLLDSGAITQAEYDGIKAKVLA